MASRDAQLLVQDGFGACQPSGRPRSQLGWQAGFGARRLRQVGVDTQCVRQAGFGAGAAHAPEAGEPPIDAAPVRPRRSAVS